MLMTCAKDCGFQKLGIHLQVFEASRDGVFEPLGIRTQHCVVFNKQSSTIRIDAFHSSGSCFWMAGCKMCKRVLEGEATEIGIVLVKGQHYTKFDI